MKNDMRVRRGGSDRLIRRFIAGTVLLMLLLLGGRYIGRAAGSIPRNDYRRMIKAGGQWLVETIWIQAQPGKRISGEGGGDPYVGQADPDPSYRKYQAVKTFYQEHQYLAWYGNEETGQQSPEDEQLAAASGQGSGQGTEYVQGNADGNTYTQGNAGRGGAPGSGLQGGSGTMEIPETLTGTLNRPITGNTYVME